MKIEINIKSGSKFQEEFITQLLPGTLIALKEFFEAKHKNNIMDIKIK